MNLTNEALGLNAQRTLAPARPRYANSMMMWGGQPSLARRERYRMLNKTEAIAMTGQKIRGSGRAAAACSACSGGEIKVSSGNTIKAKAHAKSGMTVHISNFLGGDLGRLGLRAPIGRLGTRILHGHSHCMPAT